MPVKPAFAGEIIMTDDNTASPNPVSPPPAPQPGRKSFFRNRWIIAGAFVLTGFAGFGLGKVTGHRGFHHGFGMSRGMDQGDRQSRLQSGLQRMLGTVDATPEQRDRITAIARSAMQEMQPLRQAQRDIRSKLAAALKSETVDRSAIGQLRTQQLAMAEGLSKTMSDSLLAAADVLTPSQRAQLVERWQSRRWRG
jgi:periplasmic protein CpxP/Spy